MPAEFDINHVKNIVLLGHAGSGKTTLAECFLYEAGLIPQRGNIAHQNTTGDFHELEHLRGNSIFTSLMHTRWRGYKINILDTPGYDDFSGEVLSALRVAECGIMVIHAGMGVEVGADIIWQYSRDFEKPMLFIVNQLDHPNADYDVTVKQIREHFGKKVLLLQYPLQQGEGFHCIVDLLQMKMYRFKDTGGKPEKCDIPDIELKTAEDLHRELIEAVAGNDERLMEKYFNEGMLDEEELREGLKAAITKQELYPLFCCSAERNMGAGRVMSFIDMMCPGANEMPAQQAVSGARIDCNPSAPVCAFIYKTIAEPHVGELSFLKVYSGCIKTGMELVNENTGVVERINQLFIVEGSKKTNVNELCAGDIGATVKLKNTHANNTLHERGFKYALQPISFPPPNMSIAIHVSKKGDEDKLSAALHQLVEEDPTIIVEVSPELRQTLIYCQGDMHLAVIKWKLENQYKLEVVFEKPGISYRETILTGAEAVYRHKKQSGGAGQFAEVHMRIEPWIEGMPDPLELTVRSRDIQSLSWGGTLAFYNCIVGGAIDLRFLPSIMKGVMEKMQNGPLTGSYVRDVRVSVFDGKMHPVDSNDISFKIAGMMAFKSAFKDAAPQLLEPVQFVEVLCPDDITGAVMGDLQTRRALVEGVDTEGSFTKVIAQVPLAELQDYSSALRSLTQGRSKFRMRFHRYAVVPFETQRKLSEAYNKVGREELVS